MWLAGGGGKKRNVSSEQCGQVIFLFSSESVTGSNSIFALQCWHGQVTKSGIFPFPVVRGERQRREPDAPRQRHREAPWTQIRQAAPVWAWAFRLYPRSLKNSRFSVRPSDYAKLFTDQTTNQAAGQCEKRAVGGLARLGAWPVDGGEDGMQFGRLTMDRTEPPQEVDVCI